MVVPCSKGFLTATGSKPVAGTHPTVPPSMTHADSQPPLGSYFLSDYSDAIREERLA